MGKVADLLAVGIGALCAAFCGAATLYQGLFTMNRWVPVTIDHRPQWHQPPSLSSTPIINNLLLLLLFVVSHSLFARDSVKSILSLVIPSSLYRQFYFLVAGLALFTLFYCWMPMPHIIWDFDWAPLNYIFQGTFVLGNVITTVAFFTVSPLEFIGIYTPLYRLLNRSITTTSDKADLIQTGVYRYVRHPMYTGVFLMIWSSPKMSVGHLLVSSVCSLYVILAVKYFEEPALVKTFGSQYKRYQQMVPKYFPLPGWSARPSNKDN